MTLVYYYFSLWNFSIDIAVQVTGKEKEQQLQAGLDVFKRMSRAKDQQIIILEQELQEQKSKWKCITTDNDSWNILLCYPVWDNIIISLTQWSK